MQNPDAMRIPEYEETSPGDIAVRELAGKLQQDHEQELMRRLLATEEGRALAYMLISTTVYVKNLDADPVIEGRRSVGLDILEMVFTSAPETFTMMRVEAIERLQYYEAVARGTDAADETEDEDAR